MTWSARIYQSFPPFSKWREASDKNVQSGFRHIFAGAMSGILNARGDILVRIHPLILCLDHLRWLPYCCVKPPSQESPYGAVKEP